MLFIPENAISGTPSIKGTAVPTGIKIFRWLSTVYGSQLTNRIQCLELVIAHVFNTE